MPIYSLDRDTHFSLQQCLDSSAGANFSATCHKFQFQDRRSELVWFRNVIKENSDAFHLGILTRISNPLSNYHLTLTHLDELLRTPKLTLKLRCALIWYRLKIALVYHDEIEKNLSLSMYAAITTENTSGAQVTTLIILQEGRHYLAAKEFLQTSKTNWFWLFENNPIQLELSYLLSDTTINLFQGRCSGLFDYVCSYGKTFAMAQRLKLASEDTQVALLAREISADDFPNLIPYKKRFEFWKNFSDVDLANTQEVENFAQIANLICLLVPTDAVQNTTYLWKFFEFYFERISQDRLSDAANAPFIKLSNYLIRKVTKLNVEMELHLIDFLKRQVLKIPSVPSKIILTTLLNMWICLSQATRDSLEKSVLIPMLKHLQKTPLTSHYAEWFNTYNLKSLLREEYNIAIPPLTPNQALAADNVEAYLQKFFTPTPAGFLEKATADLEELKVLYEQISYDVIIKQYIFIREIVCKPIQLTNGKPFIFNNALVLLLLFSQLADSRFPDAEFKLQALDLLLSILSNNQNPIQKIHKAIELSAKYFSNLDVARQKRFLTILVAEYAEEISDFHLQALKDLPDEEFCNENFLTIFNCHPEDAGDKFKSDKMDLLNAWFPKLKTQTLSQVHVSTNSVLASLDRRLG